MSWKHIFWRYLQWISTPHGPSYPMDNCLSNILNKTHSCFNLRCERSCYPFIYFILSFFFFFKLLWTYQLKKSSLSKWELATTILDKDIVVPIIKRCYVTNQQCIGPYVCLSSQSWYLDGSTMSDIKNMREKHLHPGHLSSSETFNHHFDGVCKRITKNSAWRCQGSFPFSPFKKHRGFLGKI